MNSSCERAMNKKLKSQPKKLCYDDCKIDK